MRPRLEALDADRWFQAVPLGIGPDWTALAQLDTDYRRRWAEITWEEIRRVLASRAVGHSPSLAADVKDEVSRYAFHGVSADEKWPAADREALLGPINAEIDAYALALREHAKPGVDSRSGEPVFNIHGPVGAIQTGSGAVAHVVQTISPEGRDAIQAALNDIADRLRELEEWDGAPK